MEKYIHESYIDKLITKYIKKLNKYNKIADNSDNFDTAEYSVIWMNAITSFLDNLNKIKNHKC